jgi:hypothetical protein
MDRGGTPFSRVFLTEIAQVAFHLLLSAADITA